MEGGLGVLVGQDGQGYLGKWGKLGKLLGKKFGRKMWLKNWAKNWAEKLGKKLGGKNWVFGEHFMNSGIS